jgi:hypothetical protein
MRNLMLATTALLLLGFQGTARADAPARIRKPSFVESKRDQVLAAFLSFAAARTVEQQQDRLGAARARDALLRPGGAPSLQAGAMGAVMMSAAVFVAAHAPARLRPLVDGPVHLGPALFEGGGMGAGIGGRF